MKDDLRPHGSTRVNVTLGTATVLCGSDAHYDPRVSPSTAHRAFVHFCTELQPQLVILNGDVIDGASISRFPAIGWENKPTVAEELVEARTRLLEIEKAAPDAQLAWPLGNHDARFNTFLANKVPEYRGIAGTQLKDHFSARWQSCWAVDINGSVTVQHRWKGGAGAGRSNVVHSGRTFVTGHDHVLQSTPYVDLNGCRWGVQDGTLADINGPQFTDYTEATPKNWGSGFIVLSFCDGRLLEPELVRVVDEKSGVVSFRGALLAV
jgi:hypothetical protein